MRLVVIEYMSYKPMRRDSGLEVAVVDVQVLICSTKEERAKVGFLSKLFRRSGGGTKKYEDMFMEAHYTFKQSVEYAFKTAVEAGVKDGVFESAEAGAETLYNALIDKIEPEDKAELEKAKSRIR
jgi:hypothetical protein